jgi:hypothetical protein
MKRATTRGAGEFYAARRTRPTCLVALLLAAGAAGTLSTVVQMLLWAAFGDDWRVLLVRDARLAAALVLGPSVLPPPASFDLVVMAVATAVHFALSLAYVALLVPFVDARSLRRTVVVGAAFGLALYVVNLHGFTLLFPWFAPARGWITAAAHVAFGVTGALALRWAPRGADA